MSARIPVFAVVGRGNKGKSSVVATFVEDDAVKIDPNPGTTTSCQVFSVRSGNRTLCSIVDTPGFEDAPRALGWMQEQEGSAADRARVVERFVANFRGTGEFGDECELLSPILGGAAILYVVDVSLPYRANYEAEMEILRWTGRPRLALMNRIGAEDHSKQWHSALDQYFSVVRLFDAHRSHLEDRLGVLRALRELSDEWRDDIDSAIAVIEQDWRQRRQRAAGVIAQLLVDALGHVEEWPLADGEEIGDRRSTIEARFHDCLRDLERRERAIIEAMYRHEHLQRDEPGIDDALLAADLFAESGWRVLGLDAWQLVRAGAIGGAAVGGTVDAAIGGSSFLLGTVVGGVLGGLSTYLGGRSLGQAEILGRRLGGRVARIGPIGDANFPWVLLDRAMLHFASVVNRAHAERHTLVIGYDGARRGMASGLPASKQVKLTAQFARLRKAAGGARAVVGDARRELESELLALLEHAERGHRD